MSSLMVEFNLCCPLPPFFSLILDQVFLQECNGAAAKRLSDLRPCYTILQPNFCRVTGLPNKGHTPSPHSLPSPRIQYYRPPPERKCPGHRDQPPTKSTARLNVDYSITALEKGDDSFDPQAYFDFAQRSEFALTTLAHVSIHDPCIIDLLSRSPTLKELTLRWHPHTMDPEHHDGAWLGALQYHPQAPLPLPNLRRLRLDATPDSLAVADRGRDAREMIESDEDMEEVDDLDEE
ncbi:hypothetical protein C8J57DRAFT_1519787 [Mycena rebaudengoi]|nr:hypothetical protein C8J57DRAFT_1519787 [Mycena rebaudengoi]